VSRYQDARFWHRRYHRKRFDRIINTLGRSLAGKESFLDAGTGTGDYLAHSQPQVQRAVGVDLSLSDLKCARNLQGRQLGLVQADMTGLPFRESSFDVVLCTEVLEHLPDLESGVSELRRVSRDTIVVTMPCVSGIRRLVGGFARRMFGLDLGEGDHAVGHVNMMSYDRVAERFRCDGWSTEVRAWYIFCEPFATYPVPSILSPLVALAEKALERFFPAVGNHALIICRRMGDERPLPAGLPR